jgi:Alkylmercury lyase
LYDVQRSATQAGLPGFKITILCAAPSWLFSMSSKPDYMITRGLLHSAILQYIIREGFAPDLKTLSALLNTDAEEIETGLYDLQDYHGVVLHPHSPLIWVIHPFSLAPTNFLVNAPNGTWWGNCAWCSLGVAALLKKDLTITTRLGA